ncbi:MAG: protein translocase SEC61 complex subunit gamma [archaeon]
MVLKKIKNFFESSRRIIQISKKPSKKEYWVMAKVVGIGMILIGVIGFIVKLLMGLILN